MNRASQPIARNSQSALRSGLIAAAFFVAYAASVFAQTQPAGSLGDLARQARAQKQGGSQDDTSPNRAQQLADELAQDQDDAGNAQPGFKTYNAGEYKLQVPAPFTVAGHDDSGIVLNTAYYEGARSMVMVGNPVLFSHTNSDEGFEDFAARFAGIYSATPGCTKISVASHNAYQCALSKATLLGHEVSGNAVFVRGAKSIFPVLCVASSESYARNVYNKSQSYKQKNAAYQVMQREDESTRNAWQTCDSIIKSIVLREDVATHRSQGK